MKLNKISATLFAIGLAAPAFASDFTIKDFRIEGEQHTSEATVRSLLPVKIGDTFTEQTGEQIIRNLHASGFYENVLLEQNGEQLIVTVRERPIISDLTVTGTKVLPNEAIIKQMSGVRASKSSSDTDLIQDGAEKSYDEKMQAYDNSSAYNTAQALASSGLGKGDFFSQEALVRALRALDGAYREMGKNNVKITPDVKVLARNRVAVVINVEEGETTKIRKLEFTGNERYSDSRLLRQINLNDGNWVSWFTRNDVFSWEKFHQDKERLEQFYRSRGYFDFRVELDQVERQLNDDRTREELTIPIFEGKQYHWGNFSISGDLKELTAEGLLKHLSKLKPGKLSDFDRLQTALAYVRADLRTAGYAYADVNAEAARRHENGKDIIDINVKIATGPKVAVRNINIYGNTKTRDEVVRRELRQMENAPYDQSKIDRSLQRLRQLGYFEDANISAAPLNENNQIMDVHVQVKERSTGSANVSAGWSQDDGLVLAAGVAQDNLFGTGKSASVNASRSKVNTGANLSFTDPYFTRDGVSMTYSLFGSRYDPSRLNNNPRSYGITKYGANATMGVPITEYDRVNIGLGAEEMRIKLFPNSPLRYQRFVDENGAKNRIYKGMLSWYRNTTDDAFWPTKGYQINVTGEAGLPGSSLQYYQLGHQQTWYFPLTRHFTLMLNGQLGYSGSYGKTREVPFFYSQTGGGLGSVRGYESGSLGPKVYDLTGNSRSLESYGGHYAANANAELLFPFPGLQNTRSVRLSLFADIGSVWDGKTYTPDAYNKDTSPYGSNGFYKSNHKSSFKNELRYSAGAAFTWLSPMGPIKLSYAYPLKKKDTDQVRRFQFQLGTVF